MKNITGRLGVFFRNLRACVTSSAREADTHYHIPKSRFKAQYQDGEDHPATAPPRKAPARNAFLGSFRDCFLKAWRDSDDHYYLPKTRLADTEYNRSAYREPLDDNDFLDTLIRFPATLMSCIAMAWKASDILHHLPKSGYQDREYVNGLMNSVPKPSGKVVIQPFRPFTAEFGVVGGDGLQEGWTVGLAGKEPDRDFFITDEMVGSHGKPEIEV
ncbi:MAG: hypothetical protein JSV70_01325 [bacterium]|nr:MAG: hypothetical protein JSV70_01325 [bacterium]